jgi:Ser/Thr protein kinase RdoA (MazF antagonist)
MTATGSRLTAPPAGLLDALERYEDAPFSPVRVLEGGWANDVFVVESKRGTAVLRVKYPPSDPEGIVWEHALLERLKGAVPEVVAPLRAADGSSFFLYGDDAVTLVPFVDGEPADRGREAHRRAAAELLGRLHAATSRLDTGPRPGVDGVRQLRTLAAAELPAAWSARVDALHQDALVLLDRVERAQLVRGVVHGDFFSGNVLMRDDHVVALIDWEEAHVAPLVFELANAVWEFTKSKVTDDFDRDAAARFVASYRDAGGVVPPAEDDLIVPLIRAKRVLELLRAPSDRHVDWDYQAHNLRSAENLRLSEER